MSGREQQKRGFLLARARRKVNRPVAGIYPFYLQAANLLAQSDQSF